MGYQRRVHGDLQFACRASKMFRFAVVVCSAALVAAEADPLLLGAGYSGLGLGYAGAAIAAPAIAAPAIATTGLIGGYSTLGGHYYGKREAEADAEPLLLGAGYAGLA